MNRLRDVLSLSSRIVLTIGVMVAFSTVSANLDLVSLKTWITNDVTEVNLCPGQAVTISLQCRLTYNVTDAVSGDQLPDIRAFLNDSRELTTPGTSQPSPFGNEGLVLLEKEFSFTPESGGHLNITCQAYGSENATQLVQDVLQDMVTVVVRKPPTTYPVFRSRGLEMSGPGNNFVAPEGGTVNVSCTVEGGYPRVDQILMQCFPFRVVGDEDGVHIINLPWTAGLNGVRCRCEAEHVTGCYNLQTTVHLTVYFGPQLVTFQRLPLLNTPFDLCPGERTMVNVSCDAGVPGTNFWPAPDYTLTINGSVYERTTGSYKYETSFRPSQPGAMMLECRVQNPKVEEFFKVATMTIQVREPPTDPPRLSVIKDESFVVQLGPDNDVILRSGDHIKVTCSVQGGLPPEADLRIECGEKSRSALARQTTLEVTVHDAMNDTTCHCRATHVTGCYNQSASFLVTLLPPIESEADPSGGGDDDLLLYVGVGVGVALIIVIAAVVVVVIRCNRRYQKPPKQPGRQTRGAHRLPRGHAPHPPPDDYYRGYAVPNDEAENQADTSVDYDYIDDRDDEAGYDLPDDETTTRHKKTPPAQPKFQEDYLNAQSVPFEDGDYLKVLKPQDGDNGAFLDSTQTLKDGPSNSGPQQVGPSDSDPNQVGPSHSHHPHQVGLPNSHPHQVGPPNSDLNQVGPSNSNHNPVGPSDPHPHQVGPPNPDPRQVGPPNSDSRPVGPTNSQPPAIRRRNSQPLPTGHRNPQLFAYDNVNHPPLQQLGPLKSSQPLPTGHPNPQPLSPEHLSSQSAQNVHLKARPVPPIPKEELTQKESGDSGVCMVPADSDTVYFNSDCGPTQNSAGETDPSEVSAAVWVSGGAGKSEVDKKCSLYNPYEGVWHD